MTDFDFTDRYGGNSPDPATICPGDCEGMGCYPHYEGSPDTTPHEHAEIARLRAEHGSSNDGYYFVTCPDCGGWGGHHDGCPLGERC